MLRISNPPPASPSSATLLPIPTLQSSHSNYLLSKSLLALDSSSPNQATNGSQLNHAIQSDLQSTLSSSNLNLTQIPTQDSYMVTNEENTLQVLNNIVNPVDPNITLQSAETYSLDDEENERKYLEDLRAQKEKLRLESLDRNSCAKSYWANSSKEERNLDYVENFKRQYQHLYPNAKELILYPKNEFGIPKFVCTTIRPTQFPFKELYDYQGCARFVADYIAYQPLDPPHELPATIPSPTYTLKLQTGNCFDMSIVLVSLLRGVGYDAYVVSGYAKREITLLDATNNDTDVDKLCEQWGIPANPISHSIFANSHENLGLVMSTETKKEDSTENKYKLRPLRVLKSRYLEAMEERAKTAEKRKDQDKNPSLQLPDNVTEVTKDDLEGLRVHAWVLILPGKREIAEAFFIEPSTGKMYSTDDSNYVGLESVFNTVNYWVNMQTCLDGLKNISFDLGDNRKWEYMFLENSQPSMTKIDSLKDPSASLDRPTSGDTDDPSEASQNSFDIPPSWVSKLELSKEKYESRCPSGSKTIIYRNAKLEIFAEYHRKDGMTSRLTIFNDGKKKSNGVVKEWFLNRRDKLVQRIRVPSEGIIREKFERGRPKALKEHVILNGRTSELHFYSSARPDGLIKRIENHAKITEFFIGRDDRLIYRSVTFEPTFGQPDDPTSGFRATIHKMTEKFSRDPSSPANQDIYKRIFLVREDKIKTIFHLGTGRIIPSWREFKKPSADQKTSFLDSVGNFCIDPFEKPLKRQHLFADLSGLLKSEQACLQAIKLGDKEVKDILTTRQQEEKNIVLTISVHDTIRNPEIVQKTEIDKENAEDNMSKYGDIDYLSPFLVNVADPNNITREEALAVRESCLKSYKERLIEKASIIQRRKDEETLAYQKQQQLYNRASETMTAEETEQYVNKCNGFLFRIHVLEKRMSKHKETATEKYIALDKKLKSDPRLARHLAV